MVTTAFDTDTVWKALDTIPDPEMPALSVVELGVIRSVQVTDGEVRLKMTPTFTACPAYLVMESTVRKRLVELGARRVGIERALDPPWTTDWLSDEAREKLRRYGIASPPRGLTPQQRGEASQTAYPCPYCGSERTRLTNAFGCALCRSMAFCDACRQPYEQLKPL